MAGNLATLGIKLNATQALAGLERLDNKLKRVGLSSKQVGAKLAKFGKLAGMAIGGLAVMSIKTAGDFEASMNKVAAIGGHTGETLQALEDQARELGRSTAFSASQAADGMTFLAMAGFDAQQSLESMPGVLNLAAATSTDLATSADIASNILSGLGLKAAKTGKLVDVMAKATSSANMNVIELGEAMKISSPLAETAGLSMEGMTAVIGKMADAGIKGSLAGTSLRAGIAKLLKPTSEMTEMLDNMGVSITNSDGSMRKFIDILQDLENAGAGATEMITIFGQRSGPSLMAAMSGGVDKIKGLREELEGAGGTAKKMADIQLQGLNGALKKLNSAWEDLQITFAKTGILTELTSKVEELTKHLGKKETIEQIKEFGRGVLSVGSAIKEVFDAFMRIPEYIRNVGIVLAFLGGRKVKYALAAITTISWGLGKLADAMGLVGDDADKLASKLEQIEEFNVFDQLRPPPIPEVTPEKPPPQGEVFNVYDFSKSGTADSRLLKFIKTMTKYKDSILGITNVMTPLQQLEKERDNIIKSFNQAWKDGIILDVEKASGIKAVNDEYQKAVKFMEDAKIEKKVAEIAEGMSDSITEAIKNMAKGLGSFRDVLNSIFDDIATKIIKTNISSPIADAISGAIGNQAKGGGIFSGLFRAEGGTVTGNQPYIVGERGAELFVPNKTGTIVPNGSGGGGNVTNINVNYSPQVNALDPRTAQVVIAENAPIVVGIVRQAFNRNGRAVAL